MSKPVPEGSYADIGNGLRMHYHDVGRGQPLVWLHGSGPGASGYSNFKKNYPFFAERGHRCIVVDNLGFGELSCYSGGPFRGVTTRRVDAFADEGFRLTNYCPESQCTPTRSALMTGRHAIRSGTHSVPLGAPGGWGLVAWEKTVAELLSEAGYACAAYGKWHVGEGAGRWPTDKGFEEWYGPPRTYDEALWPTDPWYDPKRDPVSHMVEIERGEAVVVLQPAELAPLLPTIAAMSSLRVRGLMGMASLEGNLDQARREFAGLRELRDALRKDCPPNISLAELSMGMSGDFEQAIAEGATMVRLGSVLFEGLSG